MLVKLWTIQHTDQWVLSKSRGYLISNDQFIEPSFLIAYEWLVSKMKHLQNPYNAKYPIWAWYRYNDRNRRPDLRESGHFPKGEEAVLIEFEADINQVILSDFDEWHMVLNSSEDEIKVGYFQDDNEKYYYDDIIIKSEERDKKPFRVIQGSLWHIELNQIKNIKCFKGK